MYLVKFSKNLPKLKEEKEANKMVRNKLKIVSTSKMKLKLHNRMNINSIYNVMSYLEKYENKLTSTPAQVL